MTIMRKLMDDEQLARTAKAHLELIQRKDVKGSQSDAPTKGEISKRDGK
jgi:hypothetical protein